MSVGVAILYVPQKGIAQQCGGVPLNSPQVLSATPKAQRQWSKIVVGRMDWWPLPQASAKLLRTASSMQLKLVEEGQSAHCLCEMELAHHEMRRMYAEYCDR